MLGTHCIAQVDTAQHQRCKEITFGDISPASKMQDSARVAQLVEHDLAKVGAAGSSPVSRSNKKWRYL